MYTTKNPLLLHNLLKVFIALRNSIHVGFSNDIEFSCLILVIKS